MSNKSQNDIRKVTYNDIEWMVRSSLPVFNRIYKNHEGEINEETLADLLKDMTDSYCYDDKSGFICCKEVDGVLLINAWYSEKGKGIRLWKFVENLGMELIGFMHKSEKKFKRFLEKKNYKFFDFNENLYLVRRGLCRQ